ncbi:MAG TPA: HPP family protein [Candidatus Binatia bacterium]|nr:HPP family protein [Candidatus Binatia bacterium]
MSRPPGRIDREHPLGGELSDVIGGLFRRLQLTHLLRHHSSVPVLALFSFVNGCLSIALMAVAALVTRAPFVFPSLGPTAFLFFYTPTAPAASPRNALIGHLVGAAAGWASLHLCGLADAPAALASGLTWPGVVAAGLSLGATSGLMVLLRAPHPPAGATTLIVSLGILRDPWQLGVLMLAVVLLTVQAFVINRAAGIAYPLWRPAEAPPERAPAAAR